MIRHNSRKHVDSYRFEDLYRTLKKSLIAHSVFLGPELPSRGGYQYTIVLLDPQKTENSDPFVKLLLSAVSDRAAPENTLQREIQDYIARELPSRKDEQDPSRKCSYYLMLRLQRMPFRLFFVYPSSLKPKFPGELRILKTRACWMPLKTLVKALESVKPEQNFILWLRAFWLRHVLRTMRGLAFKTLILPVNLHAPSSEELLQLPNTLPPKLRLKTSGGPASKDVRFVEINLVNLGNPQKVHQIVTIHENEEAVKSKSSLVLPVYRHNSAYVPSNEKEDKRTPVLELEDGNHYSFVNGDPRKKTRVDACLYISGAQSTYAWVEGSQDPAFFLDIAEAVLLRVGILDERLQEWYAKLDEEAKVAVLGQGVAIAYLDDARNYRQFPTDNPVVLSLPKPDETPTRNKISTQFKFTRDRDRTTLWCKHGGQRSVFDALIIHVGLLEKRELSRIGGKSQFQIAEDLLTIAKTVPFVSLCSGRGRPENVSASEKLMPSSTLEHAILGKYLDKTFIVRTFLSL